MRSIYLVDIFFVLRGAWTLVIFRFNFFINTGNSLPLFLHFLSHLTKQIVSSACTQTSFLWWFWTYSNFSTWSDQFRTVNITFFGVWGLPITGKNTIILWSRHQIYLWIDRKQHFLTAWLWEVRFGQDAFVFA